MSESGYDKVFAAMAETPRIDLPSYEDLAMTAVDAAHMHLRRDLLRGGFYSDVCLQRALTEAKIEHLKTCTAGRILAWGKNGLLAMEESAEGQRLRENARELLERAIMVLQTESTLDDLAAVVNKIMHGE